MNYLLAFLCGAIIAVMNVFNGELSSSVGTYISIVIIHLVGLITFVLIMFMKKQEISFRNDLSIFLYSGGAIGVLTVLFSVVSIQSVGASLLTALGLLGQLIASIILEQKGWFESIQKPISLTKCISLIIVIVGIGVMML